MNVKVIKEWLNDIATPTGISYSGDQTISESMVKNIVDYVEELEQQCKKQKEINQKAIEYVEEHRIKNPYHYEFNCFMGNARASDLLQILEEKGD